MYGWNYSRAPHTVQGLVLLQSSQGGCTPLLNTAWVSCSTPGQEAMVIHRTQQQPSTPQHVVLCQRKFPRDHQGTEQKQMRLLQKKCLGGTERRSSFPPIYSSTSPHFLPIHLISYLLMLSLPQFLAPTPKALLSSPIFQQPSLLFDILPPTPSSNLCYDFCWAEILLQQITKTSPVLCSLERIKLCHSSSKFMMLSVTVKKAFALLDEGENRFGQTGEVGGKRIALVVRESHNRVEIVLSKGAGHTMLAEVIPSPNNFGQRSQEWKHQLIPHLFPPKINFPTTHPYFS